MRLFAFVGSSNTGKTRLIEHLVAALKRRGYSVSVVKHCSHGFSLTPEQKDSWRFIESGSDSVSLVSPDRLALLRKDASNPAPSWIAVHYHSDADIVLVEGGRNDRSLRKIEVLRKGVAEKVEASTEELLAVVSDVDVSTDKPVFHPDQIEEIADFLEAHRESPGSRADLDIDGVTVPMKPFVQSVFENVVLGMIRSLRGVKEDPKRITLTLTRDETTEEMD